MTMGETWMGNRQEWWENISFGPLDSLDPCRYLSTHRERLFSTIGSCRILHCHRKTQPLHKWSFSKPICGKEELKIRSTQMWVKPIFDVVLHASVWWILGNTCWMDGIRQEGEGVNADCWANRMKCQGTSRSCDALCYSAPLQRCRCKGLT